MNAPIRSRMAVTGDLLARRQAQLERLVDLDVSGEFPKDALAERKGRLESPIAALESQKPELMELLASHSLTVEEIRTARKPSWQIGTRIDAMDEDSVPRRQLDEILDLRATLAIENTARVVPCGLPPGRG